MTQPPDNRLPVRKAAQGPQLAPYNTQHASRRDPFPFIMGGLVAGIVACLVLVVLLAGGALSGPAAAISPSGTTVSSVPAGVPTLSEEQLPPAVPTGSPPAAGEPPRIPMADFKKLYDDPARRPLILDVRPKDQYDQGHIKGAESFPEADLDARVQELPRDRLIVAYCA